MSGGSDRRGELPPTRVYRGSQERGAELASLPHSPDSLPALPAEYEAALDRGLVALGLRLAPDERHAIADHVRLLLAWNEAINLTAITAAADVATRHVVDSLAAVPLLRQARTDGRPVRVLDIGSGGGYPGLPLAIADQALQVTLLDSVAKKARFLEVVVDRLDLGARVRVRAARAENLARGRERWDVVTARGVGSLADLIELAFPVLEIGGRLLSWKRGELEAEIEAGARASMALGGHADITSHPVAVPELARHVLVEVVKAGPTPAIYPRDPAVRKRRPW